MWLKKGADGQPAGGSTQAVLLPHRPVRVAAAGVPAGHRVLRAMGLDMIQGDHEDSPGQLELNFTYRRCAAHVRPADDLPADLRAGGARVQPDRLLHVQALHGRVGHRAATTTCRCGAAARTSRQTPPRAGPAAGHGRRLHLSQGRREHVHAAARARRSRGRSACTASAASSSTCAALTAIGCSTVNSYRRLWDTGFWAPVFADWGYQNRTCALRISAPGRFEYRSVDATVNPYLMAAALLQAFDDGIRRKLDPGEPEERNIYQAMEEGKQVQEAADVAGRRAGRAGEGRGRSSAPCPARCTGCSCTTSATSGSGSWRPSPTGTSRQYLDYLP